MKIDEFNVRPVTRYIVTRYQSDGDDGACSGCGEFANMHDAVQVALSLTAYNGATYVGPPMPEPGHLAGSPASV